MFGGPSIEFQRRGLPHALFFFGCHMMPNSISVTIFTILFAYTVPKPKLYIYNFFYHHISVDYTKTRAKLGISVGSTYLWTTNKSITKQFFLRFSLKKYNQYPSIVPRDHFYESEARCSGVSYHLGHICDHFGFGRKKTCAGAGCSETSLPLRPGRCNIITYCLIINYIFNLFALSVPVASKKAAKSSLAI